MGGRVRLTPSWCCGPEHLASTTGTGWAAASPTGLGVHSPWGFGYEHRAFLATRGVPQGWVWVGAQEAGAAATGELPKHPSASASFFTYSF